jgi:hypothetical protein
LNCNPPPPSAAAGSDQTTPSNIVHTKAFFMITPPCKPDRPVALHWFTAFGSFKGNLADFGNMVTIFRSLWHLSDTQKPACLHLAQAV